MAAGGTSTVAPKQFLEVGGVPVLVRQGALLAAAFHPEIAGDTRLHRAVLESAG